MNNNQNQEKVEISDRKQNVIGSSWMPLIRIGVMIFVTFMCCIVCFFLIFRFSGLKSVIGKLMRASQSILIGLLLAYILNPIMKRIDKFVYSKIDPKFQNKEKAHKLSRGVGIAGTTILLLLIITTLLASVIPALINSALNFGTKIPQYVTSTQNFIDNAKYGDTAIKTILGDYVEEAADFVTKWFQEHVLSEAQTYIAQITTGVYSAVKGVLNFIIGIIVMDYVMAIQGTLSGQVKKIIYSLFKPATGNTIVEMIRKSSSIFGGFITGKLIDSAIIGVIAYIGCRIMRTPDTILVAAIIGITNIIPFFGPFIGAIPSIVLVVLQSPWHALYLTIFILVLQQVDGNIIGPKILGSSTGLSSFWVMVAILVGGGMFGVAGMIFGVPVFAVIYYMITKLINNTLQKKKLPRDTHLYTNLAKVDTASNCIVSKSEINNPEINNPDKK